MTKINGEVSEVILIRLYNVRLHILWISDACTFLYDYKHFALLLRCGSVIFIVVYKHHCFTCNNFYFCRTIFLNVHTIILWHKLNILIWGILVLPVSKQEALWCKKGRVFVRGAFIIPSPTKLRRDIVTLPSVRPSVTSLWTL